MTYSEPKLRRHFAILLGCTAALAWPLAAQAQDTAEDTEAQDTQSGGLAEIVVTAQKRAQNVQETPLSVTAISGETLAVQGVTEVADLNRVDPALQIGKATGTVTTFIRGVGNPVTTAGNEASVPVYIDDVYFIRASFAYFDLSSVERVEVLKGPQGTLFGRNASGGVINIVTKDPDTSSPEMKATLGYGNYQTMDASLYANMPIGDRVAANIALSYNDQGEGWGRNKKLVDPLDTSLGYQDGGEDYWKGRHFSARGKLLFDLTDTIDLKLVGYYVNLHSQIGIYSRPFPGTVGGSPDAAHNGFPIVPGAMPDPSQVLPQLGFYDVSLAEEQYDDNEGYGFSGKLDVELGFADFTSITAWRKSDELYYSAGNYSDYNWLRYDLNVIDEQFSQEFQLKSKIMSPVEWILGLYYLDAKGGFNPTTIYGPGTDMAGIDYLDIRGRQDVSSYAAFGQVTYPVTDNFNITGGLRYTIDKVTGTGTTDITFLPGVFGPDPLTIRAQQFDANNDYGGANGVAIVDGDNPNHSRKYKKLTWRAAADYKVTADALLYASLSRGYKAGTFNTLPLDLPALNPEVVDAYEIGFKTEFGGNVRLNGALFWNDIKNPQIQAQRNGLVFLANAEASRTKGVELDLSWAPVYGLTFRVAGSYLDAKFRGFGDVDGNGTLDCATYEYSDVAPGNIDQLTTDCSGNRLPYASKWKFSGGMDYEHDFAGAGRARFNLSASWSDKYPWDADNVYFEPSRFLMDGSISFTPEDYDHVTFRFWMKNITGEKYNINYYAQASGSAYSSAPGAPRTFGGEISFDF
ncbi:TonB-dependent receptor [Croceicoccus mobilis]|uniref:TonB-dependent receptor n=1 Tax=Croceicoccus mobilis TaxID=1703339 RepID=A0A917DYZ0_9SPHN|nr:TonB-dependent receptor [Croceicoccus mobilis]GGD80300.1 TonB-dependent receptor [Croceicoccus mobilis]